VHETTLFVGAFVELPNTVRAQVGEAMTELLDLLFAEHIRLLGSGTAGHGESDGSIFAFCSPFRSLLS